MRFESEIGHGTTVAITLPATPRPLAPPPEPREKELSIAGWCILDPREALAAAAAQRPHLVLADLRLRDHQSGIDAVRQIRGQCGNAPALLVTGDIASDRLREVSASRLPRRSKPLTEHELLEGIGEAVERCATVPVGALD